MEYQTSFESLGSHLQYLRNIHHLTQAYVASKIFISRQTLSHYETNRIKPSPGSLFQLAHFYNIEVESFEIYLVDYMSPKATTAHSKDALLEDMNNQNAYVEFMKIPANQKQCKYLPTNEKHLLFYFRNLNQADQEDLLCFLRIRTSREQNI